MYRVLIVDDDMIVRMFLKDVVHWKKYGFSVIGDAKDGEAALKLTRERESDLILTDISMPKMDGIELIRTLRSQGFSGIIIALSCHDDFPYVKDALEAGANKYLLKNHLDENALDDIMHNIYKKVQKQIPEVIQSLTAMQEAEPEVSGEVMLGNSQIQEIMRYLERHYAEMIGLNDAARYIGLTPQYVSTMFKKEMGIGFSEYLSSLRLQKVCEQLKQTDHTVTQISREAGFPDYQYFCKLFKKKYGCSPCAYRIG